MNYAKNFFFMSRCHIAKSNFDSDFGSVYRIICAKKTASNHISVISRKLSDIVFLHCLVAIDIFDVSKCFLPRKRSLFTSIVKCQIIALIGQKTNLTKKNNIASENSKKNVKEPKQPTNVSCCEKSLFTRHL